MVTPLLFLNLTTETPSSFFTAEARALKPRTRERLTGSDGRETAGGYRGLWAVAEKQKVMERTEVSKLSKESAKTPDNLFHRTAIIYNV